MELGPIREKIDRTFHALRDVEGASEREEARMTAVIDLLGIGRPSVEILIEYLEDEDWLVREAAAEAACPRQVVWMSGRTNCIVS